MAENPNGQKAVVSSSSEQLDHNAVSFVIWFLGLFALLGLIGIVALQFPYAINPALSANKPDLSAVIALVGSAIGALSAMLAQTSTSRPSPTTVINPPNQPIGSIVNSDSSKTITINGSDSVSQGQTAHYQAMLGGNPLAVQWKVDSGQIQADLSDASKATFTAPTTTTTVTITAIGKDDAAKTIQKKVQVP